MMQQKSNKGNALLIFMVVPLQWIVIRRELSRNSIHMRKIVTKFGKSNLI